MRTATGAKERMAEVPVRLRAWYILCAQNAREANMAGKPRGVRLPEDLEREIEREKERRGTSFSAAVVDLLRESVRMRRVPGIVFLDGPPG
jgi:hypothetical protein